MAGMMGKSSYCSSLRTWAQVPRIHMRKLRWANVPMGDERGTGWQINFSLGKRPFLKSVV